MPTLTLEGKRFEVKELGAQGTGERVDVDGSEFKVEIVRKMGEDSHEMILKVGGRIFRAEIEHGNLGFIVRLNNQHISASLEIPESSLDRGEAEFEGPALITSPMAGKIALSRASLGATVKAGEAIFVLVAMKMENEIASPKKGVLKEIYVQPGALVKAGDKLCLVN